MHVFISYSRSHPNGELDTEHCERVRRLADYLRDPLGIDAWIDQYDESPPPVDWTQWAFDHIEKATRVVIVCTQRYQKCAEQGADQVGGQGVAREMSIITAAMNLAQRKGWDRAKFLPVAFSVESLWNHVPHFVSTTSRYLVDLSDRSTLESLAKVLRGETRPVPPVAQVRMPPVDDSGLSRVGSNADTGGAVAQDSDFDLAAFRHETRHLSLGDRETTVLFELVRDPQGFETREADFFIRKLLALPDSATAQELLQDLMDRRLISLSGTRYKAEIPKLRINTMSLQRYREHARPYEDHGEPFSETALAGLNRLIEGQDKVLKLAFDIAVPRHFPGLAERVNRGLHTTLLVPTRDKVEAENKKHYNDALVDWRRWIKSRTSKKSGNVELRCSNMLFRDIYTSALTESVARFRVRFMDSNHRRGSMLQVKRGTTLYELIKNRYDAVLADSNLA